VRAGAELPCQRLKVNIKLASELDLRLVYLGQAATGQQGIVPDRFLHMNIAIWLIMHSSTGKKMSPMRALQYSSALDTHEFRGAEEELIQLNKQIRRKEDEIKNLKQSFFDKKEIQRPLKDVGKCITFSRSFTRPQKNMAVMNFDSPYQMKEHTIAIPNPRFSDFNPITGMNRYMERSYSPFNNVGKNVFRDGYMQRPLFN
jgi:hypothetical protein